MALETAGAILRRLYDQPATLWSRRDAEGYRLDCCDACPVWSYNRRAVQQHRVHCRVFESTVIYPWARENAPAVASVLTVDDAG